MPGKGGSSVWMAVALWRSAAATSMAWIRSASSVEARRLRLHLPPQDDPGDPDEEHEGQAVPDGEARPDRHAEGSFSWSSWARRRNPAPRTVSMTGAPGASRSMARSAETWTSMTFDTPSQAQSQTCSMISARVTS